MTNTGNTRGMPVSRKEAKAAGLKTFTQAYACTLDGTRERRTSDAQCMACIERQRSRVGRAVANALAKRHETIKQRAMAAARRQIQAEAEKARKAAQRAAAKQAREAAELAEKRAMASAKAKAARAAKLHAMDTASPPTAVKVAPWDEAQSPPWD